MNLHGLVKGTIGIVNPEIPVTLLQSTGYTTNADGTRVPTFSRDIKNCQVQSTSGPDIQQLAALNIQGVVRVVFLDGNWNGVVKADNTGGDILKFSPAAGCSSHDWKVAAVKESWPHWSSVYVVMQSTVI